MNYPVWYLPDTGGGLLIAIIAIVHVFISHFAVGGGLYLVMAERKGLRENNPAILEFTRKHTKFFMLITLVFGGITGVGIWFIIALVQPAAVSMLIHTFVYGWAAEWVWFLVEIIALMVYYYTFGKMDSRTHQKVGWIYFFAAWMSLFLINGIIGFMLTPGSWLDNQNFWAGFFNPSFWPALFVRSFISFGLAGLYAFITCAFLKDRDLRLRMTRYSGKWALGSLLLALPSAWWYVAILPEPAARLVKGASPTIQAADNYALYSLIVLFILVLLLAVVRPAINTRAVALLTLVPAFVLFGAFEWTREAARRPFVINEIMYSNGVSVAQAEAFNGESFLAQTRFAAVQEVTDDNLSEAGAELFKFQCYACHTIGGINNDILSRTAAMDFIAMTKYLRNIIHQRPYMPPFLGTELEAQALAAYIVGDLHGEPILLPAAEPAKAGQLVYDNYCIGCHNIDIVIDWAEGLSTEEILSGLTSLSQMNAMMDDFTGTAEEARQLALFLATPEEPPVPAEPGRIIYQAHCVACHEIDVIQQWAQGRSLNEVAEGLANLSQLNAMMTDFVGPDEERRQLAAFLLAETEAAAAAGAISGREVYDNNCIGCHDRDIVVRWAAGKSSAEIDTGLAELGQLNPMMQGMTLEQADRAALTLWLELESKGGSQ